MLEFVPGLSWHAGLAILCALCAVACWTAAWIARPRAIKPLPPPSHHCKRRGPEAAGRVE